MKNLAMIAALAYLAWTFVPAAQPKTGAVAEALRNATARDKCRIADFYDAMADVTERDGGERIPNLMAWRAMHKDALGLAFGGTDLVGKYHNLDVAIDGVLKDAVGLDNVPLSQVASKLTDACEEIAASAR